MPQESLPFPDGFKDVISSVESGDKIQILMSRTQKSIKKDESSYVKNLRVEISFYKRHGEVQVVENHSKFLFVFKFLFTALTAI